VRRRLRTWTLQSSPMGPPPFPPAPFRSRADISSPLFINFKSPPPLVYRGHLKPGFSPESPISSPTEAFVLRFSPGLRERGESVFFLHAVSPSFPLNHQSLQGSQTSPSFPSGKVGKVSAFRRQLPSPTFATVPGGRDFAPSFPPRRISC